MNTNTSLLQAARRASGSYRRIVDHHIGEFTERFASKAVDYGDGADSLGIRGQYADIHRKFTKLRKSMWDGEELLHEQLDEIMFDLIGHCFLTIDLLNRDKVEDYGPLMGAITHCIHGPICSDPGAHDPIETGREAALGQWEERWRMMREMVVTLGARGCKTMDVLDAIQDIEARVVVGGPAHRVASGPVGF